MKKLWIVLLLLALGYWINIFNIRSKYDSVGSFSEGLAEVELNDKWGFIDTMGNVVIPLKYDNAGFFSEGLAGVELDGKYGFVDTTGKEVVPLKYDSVNKFEDGLAKVELNGKWWFISNKHGHIDKTGHEYWDMTEAEARRQMKNR